MRITIGHVLLLSAVGAVVYFGRDSLQSLVADKTTGITIEAKSLLGLFKSGESESKKPDVLPADTPPVDVPLTPMTTAESTAAVTAGVPVPEPQATPAPKTKAKSRRSRRSRARHKTTVAKAPAVKPASKSLSNDNIVNSLLGTYVSLELKTGRKVQGILQKKTATEYTVQLPGLGPFTYPVSDVIKISKAE